ncbi:TerC family protein [Sphingomonas sp.]|uniref:TerC family protein n=1 Tax=Sphingomonas sp. TaxID=28214 RepID=UPI001EC443B5|nr:TerC family protein [Sphingomonas sp.]MBX3593630.1 TerC family protein [Sphingomonas sp.]
MIDLMMVAAQAAGGAMSLGDMWANIVKDFSNLSDPAALAAFGQVLMIDLVLAGDNAIVVGALAAGLPAEQRRKVILIGIGAALVLRIAFALVVTWLMGIVGLVFAGGLLLLWVSWKFWREIREGHDLADGSDDTQSGLKPGRSFAAAAWAVAVADVSMSLDNVLAVAGAARAHPGILIVGLLLSVALMGLAANAIAKLIDRYRWIAYIGLVVILFVACKMIYEGLIGGGETIGLLSVFG